MSIPPLVCSTPPPPDQCEDDKDPEDFDLQYNLSQDDDENYDYGNFSTYNHFQASTIENKKPDLPIIAKVIENNKNDDPTEEGNKEDIEIALGTNTASELKIKLEEDVNIEDLNLKVDQEIIERTSIIDTKDSPIENETTNNNVECIAKELDILDDKISVIEDDLSTFELASGEIIEPPDLDQIEEIPPHIDDTVEIKPEESKENVEHFIETVEFEQETIVKEAEETIDFEPEPIMKESEGTLSKLEVDADDDFGDFDDFQFASTDKPATLVDNCDNPWNSGETDDNGFGDFKASFDDTESNIIKESVTNIEHSREDMSENETEINDPEDDDFGDFDDFKSSTNENAGTSATDEFSNDQVTVLNLQSDNESQLMERIDKILSSIFEEEIPLPESEYDGKLESFLSETWGHILETDVRQPYMVNWNNSLGQQTLLKSLCIDSRNILFGPKWSYNMPKYAANLSAAPLQPQKQPTSTASQSESSSQPDKAVTKTTGTWNDPFTSDGQESCNTDTSENATAATRPTDLNVMEAARPKPDKLFSSTINVQPLRQINLPDTHIFTPTDSETPRSKTIHYDNPTVLLPQTVMDTNKNLSDTLNPQPSTSTADEDNEYWEFQDFKGASDKVPTSTESQIPLEKNESVKSNTNTKLTHATQLLQPIKLDPLMPTLNWPDPGEVKETFDDFSDFVSNSTWSNEKQDSISIPQDNDKPTIETDKSSAVKNELSKKAIQSNTSDSFDDEFDTFQSALPTSKSTPEFNFTNSDVTSSELNTSPQKTSQKFTDFDNVFPKIPKSETISFANQIRPNNSLVQNPTPVMINSKLNTNSAEHSVKSLPIIPATTSMPTNVLQPTMASSSSTQSQQKSAQILQPLSLESYSQINWPNPGIDLQDLSRFNPVETLRSLKSDLSTNSHSKGSSPVHTQNSSVNNQASDDDIWGEFVSSKPKQQQSLPKKTPTFADDDEWTDFVSSPSVKPQNGVNTISFNVHTNLSMQKSSNQSKFAKKNNQIQLDIPSLNYITPKTSNKTYNDRHFQNL